MMVAFQWRGCEEEHLSINSRNLCLSVACISRGPFILLASHLAHELLKAQGSAASNVLLILTRDRFNINKQGGNRSCSGGGWDSLAEWRRSNRSSSTFKTMATTKHSALQGSANGIKLHWTLNKQVRSSLWSSRGFGVSRSLLAVAQLPQVTFTVSES